ncbi:hypothetical protein JCM8097_006266 [Rhodosporidiobolus ruineniae]
MASSPPNPLSSPSPPSHPQSTEPPTLQRASTAPAALPALHTHSSSSSSSPPSSSSPSSAWRRTAYSAPLSFSSPPSFSSSSYAYPLGPAAHAVDATRDEEAYRRLNRAAGEREGGGPHWRGRIGVGYGGVTEEDKAEMREREREGAVEREKREEDLVDRNVSVVDDHSHLVPSDPYSAPKHYLDLRLVKSVDGHSLPSIKMTASGRPLPPAEESATPSSSSAAPPPPSSSSSAPSPPIASPKHPTSAPLASPMPPSAPRPPLARSSTSAENWRTHASFAPPSFSASSSSSSYAYPLGSAGHAGDAARDEGWWSKMERSAGEREGGGAQWRGRRGVGHGGVSTLEKEEEADRVKGEMEGEGRKPNGVHHRREEEGEEDEPELAPAFSSLSLTSTSPTLAAAAPTASPSTAPSSLLASPSTLVASPSRMAGTQEFLRPAKARAAEEQEEKEPNEGEAG